MSVMNRKMFSNRDARTKLAGMGGILASSPELMGAAQRFQTGGQGVPRPGTGYGNEIFGEGNIFSSGAGAASGGDMVILGNTVFYLVDNGTVIDREGNVIRDPSIVQAVIQKVSGAQPSQAQLAQQGTQDRVNIAQQVMAQPPAPAVDGGGGIADLMRSLMTPVADTIRGPVQELGEVIEGPVQDLGASMQQSMEPLQNAIAAGRVDPTALVTPEIVDDVQELPAAESGFSLNNTLRSIFEPVGDMASEVFSPVGDLMEDNELRSAIRLGREQEAAAAVEAQRIAEAERANAALNAEEAGRNPPVEDNRSVLDQLRSSVYSNNPLETALESTGLDSNVIGNSVITPFMNRINEIRTGDAERNQSYVDANNARADEVALAAQEGARNPGGERTEADKLAQATALFSQLQGNITGEITAEEEQAALTANATEETDVNSVANALNLEILGSANGVYVVRNEDGEVSELTAGDLFASVEDLGRVPEEGNPEYLQNLETEYKSLLDRIADPRTSENERTVLENRKKVLEERYDSNLLLSNLSYPNLQSRFTRGALDLAGNIGSKLGIIEPETAIGLLNQADAVVVPKPPTVNVLEEVRAAEAAAAEADAAPEAAAEIVNPEVEVVAPAAEAAAEIVTPEVVAPEVVAPAINTSEIQTDIAEDPGAAGKITADALLKSTGVDTSNMSVKDQTVAMKKMLTDLMGQTDEDEKEQFWMNMAMLGFGIATGESPDAMKNIADGLLASTAQISKNTTDKKARDDKFTLTAFGEVLADKRAREKFGRDLAVAKVKGTDSIYGKRTEPLTQMYRLAETLYAGGSGDYETYDDALNAARTRVSKDYKMDLSDEPIVVEKPVVKTQAEYDALPSGLGTEFIQNGELRKKP